jgi:glycerol-3-phosphate dehydrogenase
MTPMWIRNWRETIWSLISQPWDVIIIGGGITGAGILREATRLGLKCLLVEQRDFAWGASSRSSKLVHGGLRYLVEGKLRLTREAVRERELLLKEGTDLVQPVGYLFPIYKGNSPSSWSYRLALSLYDLLASHRYHRHYRAETFQLLAPRIAHTGLTGGFRTREALIDDARLVLRVLQEAVDTGGTALNYVRAQALLWDDGRVVGVRLQDREQERTVEVRAKVVVNATGAWADQLRGQVGAQARLRPLRGSHLIFPSWRLTVPQAVGFPHPLDRRFVAICPWESVTLVGTTDSDYAQAALDDEPGIQPEEVAYLMAAVEHQFPALNLTLDDVIATFSGVRPVIGTGKTSSTRESRDHAVWEEQGLLTITGGKLTTFHLMALDTLKAIRAGQTDIPEVSTHTSVLNAVKGNEPGLQEVRETTRRRLQGRYGAYTPKLVARAQIGELESIPGTEMLWAELRWSAHAEGVVHLEDLLLRRVRLGLVLPEGGKAHLSRIRAICQAELGWDDAHWEEEEERYLALVRTNYGLPDPAVIPDWHQMLAATRKKEHR